MKTLSSNNEWNFFIKKNYLYKIEFTFIINQFTLKYIIDENNLLDDLIKIYLFPKDFDFQFTFIKSSHKNCEEIKESLNLFPYRDFQNELENLKYLFFFKMTIKYLDAVNCILNNMNVIKHITEIDIISITSCNNNLIFNDKEDFNFYFY